MTPDHLLTIPLLAALGIPLIRAARRHHARQLHPLIRNHTIRRTRHTQP